MQPQANQSVQESPVTFASTDFVVTPQCYQAKRPATLTRIASRVPALAANSPPLYTGVGIIATMQAGPATDNWNGTHIFEIVSTVSNSCPPSTKITKCNGMTTPFYVGGDDDGDVDAYALPTPATPNNFYDNHTVSWTTDLLGAAGVNSCTLVCQQTYHLLQSSRDTDRSYLHYSFQYDERHSRHAFGYEHIGDNE